MKKLRRIHTFLGVFFSPLLIYYLISGLIQLLAMDAGLSGLQQLFGIDVSSIKKIQTEIIKKIENDYEYKKIVLELKELNNKLKEKNKALRERKSQLEIKKARLFSKNYKKYAKNDFKRNKFSEFYYKKILKKARSLKNAHLSSIGVEKKTSHKANINYARFAVLMIIAILITINLGIIIAIKFFQPRWQIFLALILGIVLPCVFFYL